MESLTTEVGPRPAGSPGDKAAVAWALREMQRLGFANVRTMEAIVPHWVRGEAEFAVLAPWPQIDADARPGRQRRHGHRRHRGRCRHGQGPRRAGRACPRARCKDKIVFFSNRMERTRDGSGYGKAVTVRAAGPSAAAALGARGVVIRSDRHQR